MKVKITHPTNNANQSIVEIGELTFYFSYETVIAFRTPKNGLVISQNYWGKVTGKHLNYIDSDKKIRVTHPEFKLKLSEILLSL